MATIDLVSNLLPGILSAEGRRRQEATQALTSQAQPTTSDSLLAGLMAPMPQQTQTQQTRTNIGRLFGLDTRPPMEKLQEQLAGLDPTNPDQQKQIVSIVSKINPVGALQLATQFQAQNAKAAYDQAKTDEAIATTALRKEQSNVVQQEADTARINAESNRRTAESNEMRVKNDVENWEAEYQLKQDTLEVRREEIAADLERTLIASEQLKAGDREYVREEYDRANEQAKNAYTLLSLANAYEAKKPLAGVGGRFVAAWNDFLGTQGEEDTLRIQYQGIKNSASLQNLPPGAASDKDVELALAGWPSEFANPEQISSFVRGIAKIAAIDAEYTARKAKFIAENKGLPIGFDKEWRDYFNSPEGIAEIENKYGIDIRDIDEQAKFDEENSIDFSDLTQPKQQTRRGSR
jgi:hypothetical protein